MKLSVPPAMYTYGRNGDIGPDGNYQGSYGYDMDAQSDLINIAIIVIYGVAIFIVLVADMVVRCGKGCPESKYGCTRALK